MSLSKDRKIDRNIGEKVVQTICAMANNGPNKSGQIIIGVSNKDSDAAQIKKMDHVDPRKVGRRFIVGVSREAKVLNISMEAYFSKWKDIIRNSKLSPTLRDAVMSHIDFNSFYGLGIIVINIPPQSELSYVDDDIYWRNGDSTERAATSKQVAFLAKRF